MRETARAGRPPAPAGEPGAQLEAVPVRHLGRWLAGAFVLLVAALLVRSAVQNPRFQWDLVGRYLTADAVLTGVLRTIELTALAMAIGAALGVVLAIMRLSPNPIVAGAAWLYVWFFRGTPVLVQLLFWNFLSALYPVISIGLPFGPSLELGSANAVITTFAAAILGLGLNEGAYMAEIVRAGIISVDEGQTEAALSLGMTRLLTMRRIVLPQAMRVIVPPTGNEVISMLKTSSLVSVISYAELLYSVQLIYSRTYQTVPLLIVAAIWYLVLTSLLTIGQSYVERRFGRGSAQAPPPTPLQRFRRNLSLRRAAGSAAAQAARGA